MSYRCFITFAGMGGDLSSAAVSVLATVFNSDGSLVDNPYHGVFNTQTDLAFSSTLASLKSEAQAKVAAEFGFTPTFVWLDDRGLL